MDDTHITNDDQNRRVPDKNPRVVSLSDVDDFQIADGYPDPRGWDVMASDGRKVGKVHDLIVDTGQLRTRYLDVSLDKDAAHLKDDRDVLIPIGAAQLDDSVDHVVLGSLSTDQVAAFPEFTHDQISRDYENSVLDHMKGTGAAAAGAADMNAADRTDNYYKAEHFDDRQFYGSRGTRGAPADSADTTNSRATTDTNTNKMPVVLRHEEVTIERRPLRADQTTDAQKMGDNETPSSNK